MDAAYDPNADDIIQALIAEAQADPDVIGLILIGSRAIVGAVTSESDYDLIFVVTDEALTRYQQAKTEPARGTTLPRPIGRSDMWHESPASLQLDKVVPWGLPAYAESKVIYDRTGETTRAFIALQRMPVEMAQKEVAHWYDAYLNGLYRSLKSWRRGNELGGRMEAAETTDSLLHLLYALDCRWRPYSSRLIYHLNELASLGWQSGELREILLDLISTGNPRRQQVVARRVVAQLQARGFGHVYDSWEGKIDEILAWDFD